MRAIKKFLKQFKLIRDLNEAIKGPKTARREANLRAIENLAIPPNPEFTATLESVQRIEGMFSPFSIAVMDMMLAFQEARGIAGDILEIGTFKGKSAALLGRHLKNDERLVLADIADYLNPAAIEPFKARTDFILTPSSELRKSLPRYRSRRHTFRFIHIDASHGYEETFQELRMADELLAPLGLISLDDFTNLNYSQNIAAIFKYLYTSGTDLVMLLTTDEKGYLCRKREFDGFADLILSRSIAELKSRNVDVLLARTSYVSDYKAFYLRGRSPGETGAFYGEEIFARAIVGY